MYLIFRDFCEKGARDDGFRERKMVGLGLQFDVGEVKLESICCHRSMVFPGR